MTNRPHLPDSVSRLAPGEAFSFACHKGVNCFTECCRLLELALTPYDVLRLRRGTGLTSQQLHDRYLIEEHEEGQIFPKYYLTMVDDGRASCAFVAKEGCRIYAHRPGACRAYPLGRAAMQGCRDQVQEFHVLLKESHCQGFAENVSQDAQRYTREQGLTEYNTFNDAVATLLQHRAIRQGRFTPSPEQVRLYTLALYDIDRFREEVASGELTSPTLPETLPEKDEELLLFAIDWLKEQFFGKV